MSGIEVAGLVLGALPLVVSGLQFYCGGVGTMKRYFRYKLGLKDLDRRIKIRQALFINICEDLLGGLLDPIEIETLVKNPKDRSWNSSVLEKRLRRRLQGSYRSYMDTVADVHSVIRMLSRESMRD